MLACGVSDLPIVVVLGAGRSGTNIVADIIGAEPTFHNTLENRYVWNYGQKSLRHDVRSSDDATNRVKSYIGKFFERQADKTGAVPIDKTPSNVFRVPFVLAVFPNAKFIHVVRDGRANVFSRVREWEGGNSVVASQAYDGVTAQRHNYRAALVKRRLERVREMVSSGSLPIERVPAFLLDNINPIMHQLIFRESIRYGERFPGIHSFRKVFGPLPTCAVQWREAVMQAKYATRHLDPASCIELRYEDLTNDPLRAWKKLSSFLGVSPDGPGACLIKSDLRPNQAPNWEGGEYSQFLETVEPLIRPTCEYLGYAWSSEDQHISD